MTMSLGAYKPTTPFLSLRVIVGLIGVNQRSAKATQQRKVSQQSNGVTQQYPEVSRVSKKSLKTERSIEIKPQESDQILSNSTHSETRSENKSANYATSSEKIVENKTENKPRSDEFDAVTLLIRMHPVNTTHHQRVAATLRKRSVASKPSSSRDLPFDPDKLKGYDWTGTQRYYITAEFTRDELKEGILFILGDGKYYGRYYNAPLVSGAEYTVWFGVVVVAGDKIKTTYIQVVPGPGARNDQSKSDGSGRVSDGAVAAIVLVLLLVVIVVVVIALIMWKRYRRHYPARYADIITYHKRPNSQAREVSMLDTGDEIYNSSHAMSNQMMTLPPKYMAAQMGYPDHRAEGNSNMIPTKHFVTYFDDKIRCEQALKYEHNALPRGFTASCSAAQLPTNGLTNRSPSVVPYDKNRAVLIKTPASDSDYINASVIKLTDNRTYIVTQAPLATGFNDLWRLVWDYDVSNVVMLMDTMEKNKPEVSRYWPLHGHAQSYGDISVTVLTTEVFADMTSRLFRIHRYGHSGSRLVHHLQYHWWTVGGIPLHTIPFLQYVRKVDRMTKPGNTVLVQCHTGGGRSGLYIAVDHLITAGKESGTVDVFKCVTKLRLERVQMVNTTSQYRFVHACLAEVFSRISTIILNDQFRSYYDKVLHDGIGRHSYVLSAEFEDLRRYDNAMVLRSQTLPVGMSSMYTTPNRRLPATTDALRSATVSERRHGVDYEVKLDGYYLDSYLQRDAFLLTQTPVRIQFAQFWDIVYGCKTVCMISCDLAVDGSMFWPKSSVTNKYGPYSITNHHEEPFEQAMYMRRDIALRKGDEKTRIIRQYQMCNWPVGAPAPVVTELLDMVQDVSEYLKSTGSNAPVLIHCTDAVIRSALVTVCWILLQKAEVEGEVDLYRTAKYMRHNAPGSIPTLEQYKFCYGFLNQYIKKGKYCHQSPAETDRTPGAASTSSPGGRTLNSGRRERGGTPGRSSGSGRTNSAKKRLSGLFRSPRWMSEEGGRMSTGREASSTGDSGKREAKKSPVNRHRTTDLVPGEEETMMLTGHQNSRSNHKQRTKSQGPRSQEEKSRHRKTREQSRRPQMSPPPVPTAPPPVGLSTPTHAVSPSVRPSPLIRRVRVSPLPSDDDDDDYDDSNDNDPSLSPSVDVRRRAEVSSPPDRSTSRSPPRVSTKMSDHKNRRVTSGKKVTDEHAFQSGRNTREDTCELTQSGTPEKEGTVQVLTPHSKIAKARRAYFGIESPAPKSSARQAQTMGGVTKETDPVKRKLFGSEAKSKEEKIATKPAVPNMYQIAYGEVPEGASGEEWEYSVHDISEELHTPATTTKGCSPSEDSKSAMRGRTPIVKVRSPTTRGHSPVCTTRGRETKVPSESPHKPTSLYHGNTSVTGTRPSPGNYADISLDTRDSSASPNLGYYVDIIVHNANNTADDNKPTRNYADISFDNRNNCNSLEGLDNLKSETVCNFNENNARALPTGSMEARTVSYDDDIQEVKLRSKALSSFQDKAQSCDSILNTSHVKSSTGDTNTLNLGKTCDKKCSNQSKTSKICSSKGKACDTKQGGNSVDNSILSSTKECNTQVMDPRGNPKEICTSQKKTPIKFCEWAPKGAIDTTVPLCKTVSAYSVRRGGSHNKLSGVQIASSYESVVSARGFRPPGVSVRSGVSAGKLFVERRVRLGDGKSARIKETSSKGSQQDGISTGSVPEGSVSSPSAETSQRSSAGAYDYKRSVTSLQGDREDTGIKATEVDTEPMTEQPQRSPIINAEERPKTVEHSEENPTEASRVPEAAGPYVTVSSAEGENGESRTPGGCVRFRDSWKHLEEEPRSTTSVATKSSEQSSQPSTGDHLQSPTTRSCQSLVTLQSKRIAVDETNVTATRSLPNFKKGSDDGPSRKQTFDSGRNTPPASTGRSRVAQLVQSFSGRGREVEGTGERRSPVTSRPQRGPPSARTRARSPVQPHGEQQA